MLLSIVVCNYNYGKFLDSSIASAVRQSYARTEVIVVDNGSTDDSAQIIARWGDVVKSIFQRNDGQISAYNRGFRESLGDVIIFLDADDALDRDAGERVIAAFADPDVAKAHFRLRLVDHDDRPIGPTIPRRLADGDVSAELLNRGMLYSSSPGSGNAYRRSALARLMPLPVSADDSYGADYFALLGISLLGDVRAVGSTALGSYRLHAEGVRERLLFGNAGLLEPTKSQSRYVRLQDWLIERLGPTYVLPPAFMDFSIYKQVYVNLVLDAQGYLDGVRQGTRFLVSKLVRSIWGRPSSTVERVGLIGWALAVLVLPRDVGRPIARYVCNPASRGFSF